MLNEKLSEYLDASRRCFDRIDSTRFPTLAPLADRMREDLQDGKRPQIVFVCTHNSRRSHLAQLWTSAAAAGLGLPIDTWSGGTEATEFDRRAVACLQRAGFTIESAGDRSNAGYLVGISSTIAPTRCFSKIHDAAPNPSADFIAVMVCNEADRGCPHLVGASSRFSVPFEDPKLSDDTPEETSTYDERCREIAREMLWVVERAAAPD